MSEENLSRQFYEPFTDQQMDQLFLAYLESAQQMDLLFLAYLESAGAVAASTVGPEAMHLAMLAGIAGAIRKAVELGLVKAVDG